MKNKQSAWLQIGDKAFYPFKPSRFQIDAGTIASNLGRICRFGGNGSRFYSVAEHSLNVWALVKDPTLGLPALLHDAHEAYTGFGDVCAPVKDLCPVISECEHIVDYAIASKFGFDQSLFYHEDIVKADLLMLSTEKEMLLPHGPDWPGDLPEPMDSRDIYSIRCNCANVGSSFSEAFYLALMLAVS